MFVSVNPIIEALYQFKFETKILPNHPNAVFEMYYDTNRIQFDKNVLYGISGFISIMMLIFLYSQEKLINLKKTSPNPSRNQLFKTFAIRLFTFFSTFGAFCLSFAIFDDIFESLDTSSNLFVAGVLLLITNVVIITPCIVSIGIYDGFKFITFLKFSLSITIVLAICMAIGVSQYMGTAIGAIIGTFSVSKQLKKDISNMEDFFNIKGKTIFELFSKKEINYYPDSQRRLQSKNNSIATETLIFYFPKAKYNNLIYPIGLIILILGYFNFKLFDINHLHTINYIFIGFMLFLIFLFIRLLQEKPILLEIREQKIKCLNTDFLATANENNQINVINRLFVRRRYIEFSYNEIEKFEIQYDTPIGPVLIVYLKRKAKMGIVFYFDSTTTPEYILNLLNSKL